MQNKTRSGIANYKRLYLLSLIDSGVNTVPLLEAKTGMGRRTIQALIKSLVDLDVELNRVGSDRTGWYEITSWGFISKEYIQINLQHIKGVL
ncbi:MULTISPECIES: helix-turn-helix domain-containing protein [Vibrio]|uniref:Helix-turn-helix type 11 domain-containing protein n=1 Tax=Vibrio tasmaniensis TaxID=212663 RepID=A0A2N7NCU0_9VIBR|nr:helix-turn-helix domain-containing protein [Vibrio tasmaniensis]PMO89805.1 hypothetical protein BCT01_00555 [Vibrio tasmaniensis]PMP10022.1 hypothetical protein BCS92_02535 [Vibrio tasmaniensis]TKG32596.1 hypothetical protein FC057_12325 [Vibrio tasmaniensis]TKG41721.1 hypothetical protein FC063_07615 [Vibrio tasmaniensis]TKG52076.1 hypothetical protein FC070_09885 [Vibrio tasmaniensis]